MQPHYGKDIIVFFSESHGPVATFSVDADSNDPPHPCFGGALQDGVDLPGQVGEIKMSVGFG